MHDQRKKEQPVAESEEERRQRLAKMTKTGALYISVLQQRRERVYSRTALESTAALLRLVPEAYTVYNYRREILQNMYGNDQCLTPTASAASSSASSPTPADWLLTELELNSAILLKDYKIYAAFTHRDWIMAQLLRAATAEADERASADDDHMSDSETTQWPARTLLLHVLAREMRQCEQLLRLDERNFHAWNYRRRTQAVLQRVIALGAPVPPRGTGTLFSPEEQDELDFTTASINRNFSNYSAWHQRGMTVQGALRRNGVVVGGGETDRKELMPLVQPLLDYVCDDMKLLAKAVFCDPNDQAAWFYAPFLFNVCAAVRQAFTSCRGLGGVPLLTSGEQSGGDNHDVLVLCASATDSFVHTTVDLLTEEASLGDEDCSLPFYFLLALFANLGRAARASNVQAREQLEYYCDLVYAKLFNGVTHRVTGKGSSDTNDAVQRCVELLYKRLVLVDSMRAGLYEHLRRDARC